MYPNVKGWNVRLASTELGARVEYRYERGALRVVNVNQLERAADPPLRIRRPAPDPVTLPARCYSA